MATEGPSFTGTVSDDDTIGTFTWTNPTSVEGDTDTTATGFIAGVGAPLDNRVSIVNSDTSIGTTNNASVDAWESSKTYKTYGGASDLWDETWSASDINSSNFGIAFAAEKLGTITHYLKAVNFGFSIPEGSIINGITIEVEKYQTHLGGGNFGALVTRIRITVTYTEAPSAVQEGPYVY